MRRLTYRNIFSQQNNQIKILNGLIKNNEFLKFDCKFTELSDSNKDNSQLDIKKDNSQLDIKKDNSQLDIKKDNSQLDIKKDNSQSDIKKNFTYCKDNITIINSGHYILNLSCQINHYGEIGLLINNETKAIIKSENQIINFHEIIYFNLNDIIKIQNVSNLDIKTIDNQNIPSDNYVQIQIII